MRQPGSCVDPGVFQAERCVMYAARPDNSPLRSVLAPKGTCRSKTEMGKAIVMDANITMQPVKVTPSPVAKWPMESDAEIEESVFCRTVTWPGRVIEWRCHWPGPVHAPWVIGWDIDVRRRRRDGHKASVVRDDLLRRRIQRAGALCAAPHTLDGLHYGGRIREECLAETFRPIQMAVHQVQYLGKPHQCLNARIPCLTGECGRQSVAFERGVDRV